MRLKILKKLRTASLSSEFTNSYIKKSLIPFQRHHFWLEKFIFLKKIFFLVRLKSANIPMPIKSDIFINNDEN